MVAHSGRQKYTHDIYELELDELRASSHQALPSSSTSHTSPPMNQFRRAPSLRQVIVSYAPDW